MAGTPGEGDDASKMLGAALRDIRQLRRMRTSEVAQAMGVHLRRYQRLEEGKGCVDFDLLKAFADATDCDPFAILASVWMKDPAFAVRTVDNKPLVVLMLALREFHEEIGEDIGLLEARLFWGGFRRVFQELAEQVRSRDTIAETWLDERARKLGLPVSFAPSAKRSPKVR